MKRGDFYRVYRGAKNDPKDSRVFLVVSRQTLIDSKFSSVICAPIYSSYEGLSTQLEIGIEEGLKKTCAVFCDNLVSIEKSKLNHFIGALAPQKLLQLERSLRISLDIE